MKIKDVVAEIGQRGVPVCGLEDRIEDCVRVIVNHPHSNLIYVVDQGGRFLGTISMENLLRHLFPHHYEGKVHGRSILKRITAQKAEEIMDKKRIHALSEETVDTVLARMASTGINEMAVIDEEGRILADINAVDLLRAYHPAESE
jgi:CBS domain-containing protein